MHDYTTLSDRELTHLLKEDNQAAFTEIYNRFWKGLYQTSFNILRDEGDAQDVTQNIFISLWQRRSQVEIASLKSYLHQAARFLVFKAIRDRKYDAELAERLKETTAEIINDNPLIYKEQQQLVHRLLDNLPESCREVFILSRFENYTYKQIAAYLNISEKAVEKRMSKTLKLIRSGLSLEMCVALLIATNRI
jgi:RNA polymerase sigma-70 factor (ECF subfamily)